MTTPDAWLVTQKENGSVTLEFKPMADLPFNRERFTCEPLFKGSMTTPSTSAQGPLGPIPIIETFAINPVGEGDIVVEGGNRFAHERDVAAVLKWARDAEKLLASPSPAASPASPGGVWVKTLEWQTSPSKTTWYANTPVGRYFVWGMVPKERPSQWCLEGHAGAGAVVETDATAKAAAQADYEARILSALASDATPAATSGSEDGGEVDRLKQQLYIGLGASGRYFTHQECETLFNALAKPASEPAGGGVVTEATFLLDRLDEFEREFPVEPEREWAGHVRPAIARLRALVVSRSTSAGRGE